MRYLLLILLVLCGCSAAPAVISDDGAVIDPQDDAEAPDAATTITPDASKPETGKPDATPVVEASTSLPSDCSSDGGFNQSEWQQFCQKLNAPKYSGCTVAVVCTDLTSMVSPETGCHWGGDGSQGRVWCCP